jgi:hypothetical protein
MLRLNTRREALLRPEVTGPRSQLTQGSSNTPEGMLLGTAAWTSPPVSQAMPGLDLPQQAKCSRRTWDELFPIPKPILQLARGKRLVQQALSFVFFLIHLALLLPGSYRVVVSIG